MLKIKLEGAEESTKKIINFLSFMTSMKEENVLKKALILGLADAVKDILKQIKKSNSLPESAYEILKEDLYSMFREVDPACNCSTCDKKDTCEFCKDL